MSSVSYEWGWLNVGGVRGSLGVVVQFMSEYHFSFLILEKRDLSHRTL